MEKHCSVKNKWCHASDETTCSVNGHLLKNMKVCPLPDGARVVKCPENVNQCKLF